MKATILFTRACKQDIRRMNDKVKNCLNSLQQFSTENNLLLEQEIDKYLKIDDVATLQLQQYTPFCDFVAGWSSPNGNGFYNAVSFLLYGNETSNNQLRLLTSMELFYHMDYYATHRIFHDACLPTATYSNNNMYFILGLSSSSSSIHDGSLKSRMDCIRAEAIRNCNKGTPASFVCMLAMASVLKRPINSIYPACEHVEKRILKNRTLYAREMSTFRPFSIMWTNSFRPAVAYGPISFDTHVLDHFVPVVAKYELQQCDLTPAGNQPYYLYRERANQLPVCGHVNVISKTPAGNGLPALIAYPKTPQHLDNMFLLSTPPKSQSTPKIQELKDPVIDHSGGTPNSVDSIKDEPSSGGEFDIDIRSPMPFDGPPYDIGDYVTKVRQLNVLEKHTLIDNLFRPDVSFEFQKSHGEQATFEPRWLCEYPWLTYSPSVDGAFCLPCMMFSESNAQKVLKSKPLLNWSKGASTLKKHGMTNTHSIAVNAFREFRVQRMYMLQYHVQMKYGLKPISS